MIKNTNSDKNRMLSALAESLGNVSTACKSAGISRQSHYRWLKDDTDYTEAVLEQSDVALDIAEQRLMELIEEGSMRAIIFFLETKGKHRGYSKKIEYQDKSHGIKASGSPIITFGDTTHKYEIVTKEMTQEELDDIGFVDS